MSEKIGKHLPKKFERKNIKHKKQIIGKSVEN